jgi:hypothetical protein
MTTIATNNGLKFFISFPLASGLQLAIGPHM